MSWSYKGQPLTEIPEGGYIGFVYIIECIPTGQKYIGKKIFHSTSRKPVKGSTRRKKTVKESDWKNYYGSSELMRSLILTFGKDQFIRTIVRLCKSKSEESYYETKLIFDTDALIRDNYINKWLTAQINGRNLHYLKDEVDVEPYQMPVRTLSDCGS